MDRGINRLFGERSEVVLGVECCNGTGTGGGDRLAIGGVDHVSRGENTGEISARRPAVDGDRAVGVEVELPVNV